MCLRTLHWRKRWTMPDLFQSVERICVPSNNELLEHVRSLIGFQSVERICVPSNRPARRPAPVIQLVSIRRTDLCAFEPPPILAHNWISSQFQSVERICVPSNEVDLQLCGFVNRGFNPSNGFVCLRTGSPLCATRRCVMFQSVERICVPSNC